jgi:hypothetical protein
MLNECEAFLFVLVITCVVEMSLESAAACLLSVLLLVRTQLRRTVG